LSVLSLATTALLACSVPLLAVWSARRLRVTEISTPGLYVSALAYQWLLALLTYAALLLDGEGPGDVGFLPIAPGLGTASGVAILVLGVAVLAASEGLKEYWGEAPSALRAKLLPRTGPEILLFVLLCLSAGICEEFVFRGYLVSRLARLSGSMQAAALVSAALFGFGHAAFGWTGILRAAILGWVLTVPLFLAGSLLPSVVAHAAIDLLAGFWLLPRLARRDLLPSPPPVDGTEG